MSFSVLSYSLKGIMHSWDLANDCKLRQPGTDLIVLNASQPLLLLYLCIMALLAKLNLLLQSRTEHPISLTSGVQYKFLC